MVIKWVLAVGRIVLMTWWWFPSKGVIPETVVQAMPFR